MNSPFQTRVTELLDIQYPIIQGGMTNISDAGLAAAVSTAGGLGLISASFGGGTPEGLRQEIRRCRELTDKPFGINMSVGRGDRTALIEAIIQEGVSILFTSGRSPEAYMPRLKEAGVKVAHVVPSVRFGVTAQKVGVDIVVAVGRECGGSPGLDDVSTLVLVPRMVDSLSIPVIAGGGIGDARGFVAALALGAQGVQMGTRFIATRECIAHPNYKEALLQASERDAIVIQQSHGTPHRALRTEVSEMILKREMEGASAEDLAQYLSSESNRRAAVDGDLGAGFLYAGQVAGLVGQVLTVQEVIEDIIQRAVALRERLARL
ncbi:MAG: nitronate monooxygenase [Chloroflexi bacterium]|nr:nitronate monooxygenase [Chloroflexota bacterium]